MAPDSRRFFIRAAVGLAMAGVFWWILADAESCAGTSAKTETPAAERVDEGMTEAQVEAELGVPALVYEDLTLTDDAGNPHVVWHYESERGPSTTVRFADGEVIEVLQAH